MNFLNMYLVMRCHLSMVTTKLMSTLIEKFYNSNKERCLKTLLNSAQSRYLSKIIMNSKKMFNKIILLTGE